MKKLKFILILITLPCFASFGQADYKTGIGVRLGTENGLTIKHFISERSALEGLFTTRWRGFTFTGLYELTQDIFTDQLNFYYGLGGHLGYWRGDEHPWFDGGGDHMLVGFDGIIGIELTFDAIPFNLSLDWKPSFNLYQETGFLVDEVGFSVRFVIR
jgi:hypothetical protein